MAMRYEIKSCENDFRVVRHATREPIAIFPMLKGESVETTERRAEKYLALVLNDGAE